RTRAGNACAVSGAGFHAQPDRAAEARAAEAAVAVWHLRQVLLVIVLGEIELRRVEALGGDRPVAVGREHLLVGGLGCLGGAALRRRAHVDARTILGADVVALTHALGGVVALPEGL